MELLAFARPRQRNHHLRRQAPVRKLTLAHVPSERDKESEKARVSERQTDSERERDNLRRTEQKVELNILKVAGDAVTQQVEMEPSLTVCYLRFIDDTRLKDAPDDGTKLEPRRQAKVLCEVDPFSSQT